MGASNQEGKTYCVVQHSSGARGGFVVRTAWDGGLAAPYRDAVRLAEYKRLSAAERCADRMNGYSS